MIHTSETCDTRKEIKITFKEIREVRSRLNSVQINFSACLLLNTFKWILKYCKELCRFVHLAQDIEHGNESYKKKGKAVPLQAQRVPGS